jgi:hypothetical protein
MNNMKSSSMFLFLSYQYSYVMKLEYSSYDMILAYELAYSFYIMILSYGTLCLTYHTFMFRPRPKLR